MMEKIKIAYSWIGPRGPIWNTELPNILSFANVQDGSDAHSSMFWADDMWNRLFKKRKNLFELYSTQALELDDDRPFIFPFSLAWRIDFRNYFCGRTGILEFSHTPGHLFRLIRNHNGYFMIDHSVEAFMTDAHLDAMYGYFRGIHGFPMHKIIYLTGCVNAEKLHNNYCIKRDIPNTLAERMTVIAYPSSHQVLSTNIVDAPEKEPEYIPENMPEKLFLMWNRRFRQHRIEMALCLEKNNLVERSYISFSKDDVENPSKNFENTTDYQRIFDSNANLRLNMDILNKFSSRLPLVLDGETAINKMCEDSDNETRPYYQNSLISIVTETNYNLPELTLTEKSFKPIKEKHPFIVVGVPGALKAMREMGFKTFSDFWDETYDETECNQVRMQQISYQTELIGKWTPEQILDFRRKVKPILDHNYNQLKIPSSEFAVQKICKHIEEHMV